MVYESYVRPVIFSCSAYKITYNDDLQAPLSHFVSGAPMRDRNHIDWNVWFDTYKDSYASFSKAQYEGFRALERFARFNYAVAGDVLEAGLAQAKATLGARSAFGTQAIAELLE